MTYVALLRGINVGGKHKVDMRQLKATFERAGMTHVSTYINSGNVLFRHASTDAVGLTRALEAAIAGEFGFEVRVLLRDAQTILTAAAALPDAWANDGDAKCDVLFLWDEYDRADVLTQMTVKPGIDDARYVPGAILWRVARSDVTRSGLMKLLGTELYQHITVRNCNTLRTLAERIATLDAEPQ